MYRIENPAVFVSDRVLRDEESLDRLNAFVETTKAPGWEVVKDEEIPAMLERPVWKGVRGKAGARERIDTPVFFFNTFRFDGKSDEVRRRIAAANPGYDADKLPDYYLGYRHFVWFNSGQPADDIKPNPEHVCRPCWRLNISPGCPHECAYCSMAGFMAVGLNVSEYLAHLDRLVEANPWQRTYLVDDASDVLVLEPEMNFFSEMVRFFGTKRDRYLIAHTKSANVDFLRSLAHAGHTIMCYSLAAETQSTQLERMSATTDQRIEAARKCQQWGMPIRFKFKPIIPVRNWRDEARDMIRKVFEKTRPDNLSMTALMWMSFEDLEACMDLDMLDPASVDAARKAAENGADHGRLQPFPHDVRREIYEFYLREVRAHDKNTPLTLSTESLEMWSDLGPALGTAPATYTCGCGPCATPGLKELPENPWKIARRNVPSR